MFSQILSTMYGLKILSDSHHVLLCSNAERRKKGECWHFRVSDPQQMSINSVLHFMDFRCILEAQHRSSAPCQERWCFTSLHKSVCYFTLHYRCYFKWFSVHRFFFRMKNTDNTSTIIKQQTHNQSLILPWCCAGLCLQCLVISTGSLVS